MVLAYLRICAAVHRLRGRGWSTGTVGGATDHLQLAYRYADVLTFERANSSTTGKIMFSRGKQLLNLALAKKKAAENGK